MAKRTTVIARMDELARKCVRLRDDMLCQKCGMQGYDTHHVRMRKFYTTRWDLNNLVLLCKRCHSDVDNNPMGFTIWFMSQHPARLQAIEWKASQPPHGTWRPADLKKIEDYLKAKYLELKGE